MNFVSKVGKVAEPHTVTFIMDINYSLPDGTNLAAYTIPRSIQLMPSLKDFNSEAMVIPGKGEMDTVMALNARSWSPVVIDSKDKVNYLGPNKKYVLNGSEKYVNSGWLFPEEFAPPSSGGTTFTVTFENEGQYPYYCVVHPWMEGKVTVK